MPHSVPVAFLSVLGIPGTPARVDGPSVTTPWPPGNPRDGETVTVSGTGIPPHTTAPTGVRIIECEDPGGLAANLPSSPVTCDGVTVSALQINQDASGDFTAQNPVVADHSDPTMTCDQTHFCVLG